jgi:hypothetical protein
MIKGTRIKIFEGTKLNPANCPNPKIRGNVPHDYDYTYDDLFFFVDNKFLNWVSQPTKYPKVKKWVDDPHNHFRYTESVRARGIPSSLPDKFKQDHWNPFYLPDRVLSNLMIDIEQVLKRDLKEWTPQFYHMLEARFCCRDDAVSEDNKVSSLLKKIVLCTDEAFYKFVTTPSVYDEIERVMNGRGRELLDMTCITSDLDLLD